MFIIVKQSVLSSHLPEYTSYNLEGFGGVFEFWHAYWDDYTPNLLLVGKKKITDRS